MGGHELRYDRAHGARIYDYILGGKDHYPLDREAGDAALEGWPSLRTSMRANRAFMHRVSRYLATERGVTQFLDVGTGIPTSPNLHEVVQEVRPEARVVYVDNDPIVLAHARALLTSTPGGATAYIHADLREPEEIIESEELRETLDLTKPIGFTLIAMLHFIEDEDEAHRVVRQMLEILPPGSYFALSTATGDFAPEGMRNVQREYRARGEAMNLRTKPRVERFFDGLELVEPGVVQVHKWHPDALREMRVADEDVAMYGGLARLV